MKTNSTRATRAIRAARATRSIRSTRSRLATLSAFAATFFILHFPFFISGAAAQPAAQPRLVVNFNPGWRFTKSDPTAATPAANPADPAFDDSGAGWTTVSAPHTYNDTDAFSVWSLPGHRGQSEQWSGRTWYRKTFVTPDAWRGKKVFIEFEAVRQVAEVYLNGVKLGTAKSGFSPFGFDLTAHLKTDGTPNVLAVMCDNRFMKDPGVDEAKKPEAGQDRTGSLQSMLGKMENAMPDEIADLQANQIPWNNPHWHPAHGGIYRNVRIIVTDPLHITLPLYSFLETEGPYAYCTQITIAKFQNNAVTQIEVPIRNERADVAKNVIVRAEVFDADGKSSLHTNHDWFIVGPSEVVGCQPAYAPPSALVTLAPGETTKVTLLGGIANPRLWQPDYPHVYRVVCTLTDSATGKVVDTTEIPLGIRTVRWTTDEGFFINGQHLKLHGWGQKPTDEWPGLGAAQPDWLHAYTLRLMRDAGGNYVRWGHAAAGPAQINAADRLGLITLQPGVDGEMDTTGAAWKLRAATFRDVIIYFRNNPAIIIWEGGNQKVTREHAAELRATMDKYDPHGGRALTFRRADEVVAEFMDICEGTEGGHEIARLPVVEGEYDREESPRRVWDDQSPPTFGYAAVPGKIQTYRLNSEEYALNQISQYLKKIGARSHAGGANWIFSDSTSGGRVETEVARAGGEVDAARLPKEAYYVLQTLWRVDPQVHIIGHWTYPAGTKKNIYVVANNDADDVELLLNGQTLGHAKPEQTYLFTFKNIAFAPGALTAISSRGGHKLAEYTLRTAGPAIALRMTPITNSSLQSSACRGVACDWERQSPDWHDGAQHRPFAQKANQEIGVPNASNPAPATFTATSTSAPATLTADGSDIALVDVEAVDAEGNRCPTWQGRVDFTLDGPAIWRGGYNSGKEHTINNTWLDLEAGINRVALRSTLTAGQITLTARAAGLKDATLTIIAGTSIVAGASIVTGASSSQAGSKDAPSPLPVMPAPTLPATAPDWRSIPALATPQPPLVKVAATSASSASSATSAASAAAEKMAGRHTKTWSYSGPNSAIVHLDTDARPGKNAYADKESPFPDDLPASLLGADWIQTANADSLYSAVDFVQISVPAGATITVAHDDRLARPAWLTTQFKPTQQKITLLSQPMTLFTRAVKTAEDASVTMGDNADAKTTDAAMTPRPNMYLVFVNATNKKQ